MITRGVASECIPESLWIHINATKYSSEPYYPNVIYMITRVTSTKVYFKSTETGSEYDYTCEDFARHMVLLPGEGETENLAVIKNLLVQIKNDDALISRVKELLMELDI